MTVHHRFWMPWSNRSRGLALCVMIGIGYILISLIYVSLGLALGNHYSSIQAMSAPQGAGPSFAAKSSGSQGLADQPAS